MKAMVIAAYGGPENLQIRDLPEPQAQPGDVVLAVKAFGINRAETHMRSGDWPEIAPVSGIECAGVVVEDTTGRLTPGTTAIALMGGMGRTRNGTYAQRVAVSAGNVIALETHLPWHELAVIPESYATAYSVLEYNLQLRAGETILIRGVTSALGLAAAELAKRRGAHVFGTTRKAGRIEALEARGIRGVLEGPGLRERLGDAGEIDAVLDLIGNSGLLVSSALARPKTGRVCVAGFLGGFEPVALNVIAGFTPGVAHSTFASTLLGSPLYPLEAVPFQGIVDDAAAGKILAKPALVLAFEQLPDAHRAMEAGDVLGKIVVTV